ncbi:unnamed protein product [Pleuronectes platessa]|uniref:Uncharacterized protein n=1 Tax=Pleuronectes platessa TaxID=8262 RepID=A0A9N7W3P9_PLEPL|nr:unnamed protein product [Pleuronectes platessa]
MPFSSITHSPASTSHHSSHLTGTRGSVPGPKVLLALAVTRPRLVRESNEMLSDLAPLEMSAPEPADARPSGAASARTPLRLAQLLPVGSREGDTSARPDRTSSRDEPGTRIVPHIFCPTSHACFSLFG